MSTYPYQNNDLQSQLAPLSKEWKKIKVKEDEKPTSNSIGKTIYHHTISNCKIYKDPRLIRYVEQEDLPPGWEVAGKHNGVNYFKNDTLKKTSWNPWKELDKNSNKFPTNFYRSDTVENYKIEDKLKTFRGFVSLNKPRGEKLNDFAVIVSIDRKYLLESSFNFFMQDVLTASNTSKNKIVRKPTEYRKLLKIEFKDEPALDYGGPARDFFHNLSKAIFDLNFGLFIQTDDYNLSVNPNSGILHGENHLIYFRFVGRMIALCLLHQIVLDCTFSNIFYKSLLNLEIVLEDICSLDMEFYKNVKWILDNQIDELELDLTFTMDTESYGQVSTVELIPNGQKIKVTDSNKNSYSQKLINHRFINNIKPHLDMIKLGINEIMPLEWIYLFNQYDLDKILCGSKHIDILDWKRNTLLKGYWLGKVFLSIKLAYKSP